MKYIRIANKYSYHKKGKEGRLQEGTPVFFAEINVSKNNQLATSLNVEEYPFIHIYRNMKSVASFGTGPPENFSKMLEYMLDHEIQMSQDDWIWFESTFSQQIRDGTERLQSLLK